MTLLIRSVGWLVGRFVKAGAGTRTAHAAAWGIAALAAVLLAWGIVAVVRSYFVRGEVIAAQKSTIETKAKVIRANETASGARVEEALNRQRERKELEDATADIKDPDERRRAHGCAVLRQQGADTSRIPACSRP